MDSGILCDVSPVLVTLDEGDVPATPGRGEPFTVTTPPVPSGTVLPYA